MLYKNQILIDGIERKNAESFKVFGKTAAQLRCVKCARAGTEEKFLKNLILLPDADSMDGELTFQCPVCSHKTTFASKQKGV